jgi:hypothetical protein
VLSAVKGLFRFLHEETLIARDPAAPLEYARGVRGQSTILDTLEEKAEGSLREPSGCMSGLTPHPRMADPFAPHKELTTPRRLEDTKQFPNFPLYLGVFVVEKSAGVGRCMRAERPPFQLRRHEPRERRKEPAMKNQHSRTDPRRACDRLAAQYTEAHASHHPVLSPPREPHAPPRGR